MPPSDPHPPAPGTWVIPERFEHGDNAAEGHFLVPEGSPWFSGHFPGMPILPAIGMLDMVRDTLDRYAAHRGVRLTIREMKRIRFRQVIAPGARFSVSLSLSDGDGPVKVSFSCTSDGTNVCSGFLIAGTAQPGEGAACIP